VPLFPKILFQNKWKSERNWLTEVHLEMDCNSEGGDGMYAYLTSCCIWLIGVIVKLCPL